MIRKGSIVKYIGNDELLKEYNNYIVHKRSHNLILISIPVVYVGGEIHKVRCYKNIEDFEEIVLDKKKKV